MRDKVEKTAAQMRLETLRGEIDQVDKALLALLVQRFDYAIEIADIKETEGLSIYDPDREAHILRQLSMQLGENESLIEIISVFEGMLKLSKKAQFKHLDALAKKKDLSALE